MIPGSSNILKCSDCTGLIEEPTMASGNTFGARYWTDGWRDAPMMQEGPWLAKCPHCQTPLWLDALEKVGEREPWGGPDSEFSTAARKSSTSPDLRQPR